MHKIRIKCPAKINLSLKIINKRPDGFHNIESIMQTIGLYDYLNISSNSDGKKQEIKLSGNNTNIPYDENNLVYKAAKIFLDNLPNSKYKEIKNSKIEVYIEKNIPTEAGLAGGSTDAAGTIYGLNKLYNEPYTRNQLHVLCAKLGSDLNFCLEGGRKLTKGRGEILEEQQYKDFEVSLIKPIKLGISAKEAYSKFSKKLDVNAPNREKYVNDLEWAVIDDYKELQIIKALYPNSVMSGSGSTYYMINEKIGNLDEYWVKNNIPTTSKGVREDCVHNN